MPVRRKPFLGAFALAVFITACLGWLFKGAGTSFNWWGYAAMLALSALLVHTLVSLVRRNGGPNGSPSGHVRSIDSYEELD